MALADGKMRDLVAREQEGKKMKRVDYCNWGSDRRAHLDDAVIQGCSG